MLNMYHISNSLKWPIFTHVLIFLTFVLLIKCDDSETYTDSERILLPKLRSRVSLNLTQSIMHEDKYLVRFLRAQDHNIDEAQKMIMQNLKWRRANNVDAMLDEDWKQWLRRIPFMDHFTDFEGRPCLAGGLVHANARKLLIGGRGQELIRYAIFVFERGVHMIHQVSNRTGHEFITGWLLFDLAGYNLRTHGCPNCVLLWMQILKIYENYYPYLARGIIVINAPREVPSTYRLIKPLMSLHTIGSLQMYDFDKSVWKEELLKIFSKDVLTTEFGGKGPIIYAH